MQEEVKHINNGESSMVVSDETLKVFEELEIRSRQLDIQKKDVEIEKETRSLSEFEFRKQAFELEREKLNLEKIGLLSFVISLNVIDEERTIFGGEPVYKSAFSAREIDFLKQKLFKTVSDL